MKRLYRFMNHLKFHIPEKARGSESRSLNGLKQFKPSGSAPLHFEEEREAKPEG